MSEVVNALVKPLLGLGAVPLGVFAETTGIGIVVEKLEAQQFLESVPQLGWKLVELDRRFDHLENPGVAFDVETSL